MLNCEILITTDQRNIWHPFSAIYANNNYMHTPNILITQGKGAILYDQNQKKYIDAISSWWVNLHGHGNKQIAKAIYQQATTLEQVIFAGFTHMPAINLSVELLHLLGMNMSKIFFSDNGSTAVEVALKMALQYFSNKGIQHKTKIIALQNSYHGDTFGAMSVSARSEFTQAFNNKLFTEVIYLPFPTPQNEQSVYQQLQAILQTETVAAFIFEPLLQGTAGMQIYEPHILNNLMHLCLQYNALLIADEVLTGFGRTGKHFACHYLQHSPHIICLSKGLTGGFMPMGITACQQFIFEAFASHIETDIAQKTFFHGHSYTANPLACAAALQSIKLLLQPTCQQAIQYISQQNKEMVQKLQTHPCVLNARSIGTILAITLQTNTNTLNPYFNNIKKIAYEYALQNGVLLRPLGNVIYSMPPYCITPTQLQKVYSVIQNFLNILQNEYIST